MEGNFIVQNFEMTMARKLTGEAVRVNYDQRRVPITPKSVTSTEKENVSRPGISLQECSA